MEEMEEMREMGEWPRMKLLVHVHELPMWTLPDAQVDRIRQQLPGVDVTCVRSHDAAREVIGDVDVVLAPRMMPDTLAAARRLRWIHTTAVGIGWLPLRELASRDIVVTNARGEHSEILAEHAVALLLALRRRLPEAEVARQSRRWDQEMIGRLVTPRLSASRVLVVGLGSIGSRVAGMLQALGMTVIGARRDTSLSVPGVAQIVSLADIDPVLPDVDAVILALPHTRESGVVLTAERLRRMKASAHVVNVARGSLVDEAALVDVLTDGRLGGAGLDVFVEEPLPASSPLWRTPRTLITPHVAALDGDYWTPAVDGFLQNWARFVAGEPLANTVDVSRGY